MAATIAIRHQLNRSGSEGHGGPLQGGVQASTSGPRCFWTGRCACPLVPRAHSKPQTQLQTRCV